VSDDAAGADAAESPRDVATAPDARSIRPSPDGRTVVVCCGESPEETDDEAGDDGDVGDIEGEADDTTSTQMRHWLTNDLLAGFLHLTLVAAVLAAGVGYLDLSAIPPRMRLVFLATVLSATVWSFGEDVLQSIRGS
jgi:hypothetical protein